MDAQGRPLPVLTNLINGNNLNLKQVLQAILAVQAQAAAAQATADQAVLDAAAAQASADAIQDEIDNMPNVTRTVTADTNLLPSDASVLGDATGGLIILTLYSPLDYTRPFNVSKIDASPNAVRIAAGPGATINGAAFINLTTQYQQVSISSDGNDWFA